MSSEPRYAVELKPDCSPASFMAGGKAVDLDDANPRFETADRREYLRVRELPFLNDLGEVKSAKGKAKDDTAAAAGEADS